MKIFGDREYIYAEETKTRIEKWENIWRSVLYILWEVLQGVGEAGFSRWLFAKGRPLRMIICKRPAPLDNHLHGTGPSK